MKLLSVAIVVHSHSYTYTLLLLLVILLKADDHHEEKMFHYIADSFHASATSMTINEPISATKTSLRYSQVFIPALPGKLSGKFLR